MRLSRNVRVLSLAFAVTGLIAGCGQSPQSKIVSEMKQTKVVKAGQVTSGVSTSWASGDAAVLLSKYRLALYVAARNRAQEKPEMFAPKRTATPEPASTIPPVVPAATTSIPEPWACIAEAETSTDWSMRGSTYSTAFGVINDIVYQYGSPEEQREIFSGTASPQTQIAVVSRFTAQHGFGGWGVLTKQKCGL